MWAQTSLRGEQGGRVLLVTAHPDDETLFFGPLILSAPPNTFILCLSTGDYYGLGRERTEELFAASQYLGVPRDQVRIVDHPDCRDGMNTHWSLLVICQSVEQFILEIQPSLVVSFDEYGVSGHVNHIDVGRGVQQVKSRLAETHPHIIFLKLKSCFLLQKFIGLIDIWISMMCEEHVVLNFNLWRLLCALWLHRTQITWYRVLFVIFSKFTYVNTFKEF